MKSPAYSTRIMLGVGLSLMLGAALPAASQVAVAPSPAFPTAAVLGSPTYATGGPVVWIPVAAAGMPVVQAPPVTPAPVVPVPAVGAPERWLEWSHGSLDRLIAAVETSDELRRLLASSSRLSVLRADAVLQQFLRERVAGADLTASTGLAPEYRLWLLNTLVESGDRLDASLVIPNFRLLPSVMAASWPTIWSRSFAPTLAAGQGMAEAVPPRGSTTVGIHPAANGRLRHVEELAAGARVWTLGTEGSFTQVRTPAGRTGWVWTNELKNIVAASSAPTLPYRGAESVTLWQSVESRTPANLPWYAPVPYSSAPYSITAQGLVPAGYGFYGSEGWVYALPTQSIQGFASGR